MGSGMWGTGPRRATSGARLRLYLPRTRASRRWQCCDPWAPHGEGFVLQLAFGLLLGWQDALAGHRGFELSW